MPWPPPDAMVHPRLIEPAPARPLPASPCPEFTPTARFMDAWSPLLVALLVLSVGAGLTGCSGADEEEGQTRPLHQFGRNGVPTAEGSERLEGGEWLKHGRFIFRDEMGVTISEGEYESGLEVGPWTQVYADGSRGEGAFLRGQRTGPWRTFFPNGAPQDAGEYESGRRTGEWTSRRKDGTLLRIAMFVDGKENGPVTYFEADGQTVDPARTGLYRNGELQAPSRAANR